MEGEDTIFLSFFIIPLQYSVKVQSNPRLSKTRLLILFAAPKFMRRKLPRNNLPDLHNPAVRFPLSPKC